MNLEDELFFNNLPEHEQYTSIEDNNKMIDCFLILPLINEMQNPIAL